MSTRNTSATFVETWRSAVEGARGLLGLSSKKRRTPGRTPRSGTTAESNYDVGLEWLIEESRKHFRPLELPNRKN